MRILLPTLAAVFALSACGSRFQASSASVVFTPPSDVLTATSPELVTDTYSVYKLVEAKVSADAKGSAISAEVTVVSTAGAEVVQMVGPLRADGTASLVDVHPLPDTKNRLVAEALCVDAGTCSQVILNVYYNVEGKTFKRQFSSTSLRAAGSSAAAPVVPVVVDAPSDEDAPHPAEKKAPRKADPSDTELGDYVGAPRNEVLIGKLWPRSKTPELPTAGATAPKSAKDAKPSTTQRPTKTVSPATNATKTSPKSAPSVAPKTVPPLKTTAQPAKTQTARTKTPAPTNSASRGSTSNTAKPTNASNSANARGAPTTKPAQTDDDEPSYPCPPAQPYPEDSPLEQKITLLEAKLAPLINLKEGGVARGGYTDSRENGVRSAITKASLSPTTVEGLVPMQITNSAHWGTGMLVSFLQNAATYLFQQLGLKLYVGDMSLKNGGAYGNNSSHNTHRNGLDADLAWIGSKRPLQESALDENGDVQKDFDYEKTWTFLRLAAHQEIVQDAQKSTAVSRVFMSPGVKTGFCSWAKQKGLLENEFDSELMRLVRPTDGHYKHFHLSLKCSPHYPVCRNLAGPPPPGPGCD